VKPGGTPLLARAQAALPKQALSLARLARTLTNPRFYPQAPVVKTFWWADERNFGDLITPFLLESEGIIPVLKPPAASELVGVGSILELVPQGFEGVVWGSGKMHGDVETRLPNAHVAAVRGALTRERIDVPGTTALGDPGLLIGDHVHRAVRGAEGPIGLVVHFSHRSSPWFSDLLEGAESPVRDIDVRRGPLAVAHDIARCRAIVSTSLHGVIVADALGVPAVWALPEPVLAGADFKFLDHESAVNPVGVDRRVVIGAGATLSSLSASAWTPERERVARLNDGLRTALTEAFRARTPDMMSPLRVPLVQRRP